MVNLFEAQKRVAAVAAVEKANRWDAEHHSPNGDWGRVDGNELTSYEKGNLGQLGKDEGLKAEGCKEL